MKQTVSNTLKNITAAQNRIAAVIETTLLQKNEQYSGALNANIWLKREDLHQVRSYKIRGAYNKIAQQNNLKHVVCASAGNHAQGVAFTCKKLDIKGTIFMPSQLLIKKSNKLKYSAKIVLRYSLLVIHLIRPIMQLTNFHKTTISYLFRHLTMLISLKVKPP